MVTVFLKLHKRELHKATAYLTRTEEKNVSVWSDVLSLKVTVRVSLTFFRSDLERLVLSFSRAEMCCTLREEEKNEDVRPLSGCEGVPEFSLFEACSEKVATIKQRNC